MRTPPAHYSHQVMGYLKRMVREQNHVVIASIHQPRSAIWLMFDAVRLMRAHARACRRMRPHACAPACTPLCVLARRIHAWRHAGAATLSAACVGRVLHARAHRGSSGASSCACHCRLHTRPPHHHQVTLLASGRLMYHGAREGITDWFGSLGYNYDPSLHGVPSDW